MEAEPAQSTEAFEELEAAAVDAQSRLVEGLLIRLALALRAEDEAAQRTDKVVQDAEGSGAISVDELLAHVDVSPERARAWQSRVPG